jgi:hypothetical protein
VSDHVKDIHEVTAADACVQPRDQVIAPARTFETVEPFADRVELTIRGTAN